MTSKEREQILEVLEILKSNKSINSYKLDSDKNIIDVTTDETEERELSFLEFKIIMAAAVINEEFEEKLQVNII